MTATTPTTPTPTPTPTTTTTTTTMTTTTRPTTTASLVSSSVAASVSATAHPTMAALRSPGQSAPLHWGGCYRDAPSPGPRLAQGRVVRAPTDSARSGGRPGVVCGAHGGGHLCCVRHGCEMTHCALLFSACDGQRL